MYQTERTFWSLYTEDAALMLGDGCIAMDDCGLGEKCATESKTALRAALAKSRPDLGGLGATVAVNGLHRFARELRVGDGVVLREAQSGKLHLGRITGECRCRSGEPLALRRSVEWLRSLPEGSVSTGALRELRYSSASPLFALRGYADEFFALLGLGSTAEARGCAARREAQRLLRRLPDERMEQALALLRGIAGKSRKLLA